MSYSVRDRYPRSIRGGYRTHNHQRPTLTHYESSNSGAASWEGQSAAGNAQVQNGHYFDGPNRNASGDGGLVRYYSNRQTTTNTGVGMSFNYNPTYTQRSDDDLKQDEKNRRLLDEALRGNVPGIDRWLSVGASVRCRDVHGRTPLHCAVEAAIGRAVEHILEGRPEIDATDSRGYTALKQAQVKGLDAIAAIIKAYGPPSNSRELLHQKIALEAAGERILNPILARCAARETKIEPGMQSLYNALNKPVIGAVDGFGENQPTAPSLQDGLLRGDIQVKKPDQQVSRRPQSSCFNVSQRSTHDPYASSTLASTGTDGRNLLTSNSHQTGTRESHEQFRYDAPTMQPGAAPTPSARYEWLCYELSFTGSGFETPAGGYPKEIRWPGEGLEVSKRKSQPN